MKVRPSFRQAWSLPTTEEQYLVLRALHAGISTNRQVRSQAIVIAEFAAIAHAVLRLRRSVSVPSEAATLTRSRCRNRRGSRRADR